MASVSKDGGEGRYRITFRDGLRNRTIRLGRCTPEQAKRALQHVEELIAAKRHGSPWSGALAGWLGSIDDSLHDRIARVGLVEPRRRAKAATLGGLLNAYFAAVSIKAGTERTYRQTERALLDYFGADRRADSIGMDEAERWRRAMLDGGLAGATVAKRVKTARSIFARGVRWGMLAASPFGEVKAGSMSNPDRQRFVSREAAEALIDAAPSAEWRLLIALSRYGGLRVPSEAFALRWDDVDWQRSRFRVVAHKTSGQGKGSRLVPIFPELRERLLDVFESAEPGSEYVLADLHGLSNPNPQLHRIIRRAGLEVWPRTWHNMRASRQTELAAEFPIHTVCAWLGNTAAIASGHYLQLTDADWTRAVAEPTGGEAGGETYMKRAESGSKSAPDPALRHNAPKCADDSTCSKTPVSVGDSRVGAGERSCAQSVPMTPPGFEPGLPE